MAFKLLLFVCMVAVARAGVIPDHGASYNQQEDLTQYDFGHGDHEPVDYHSHPRYEFSYEVQDDHTGDVKSQQESRDGDTVRGSYTVMDPDGHKRTVEYTADPHEGFKAIVRREPVAGHISAFSGDNHQAIDASAYQGHGYEVQQAYDDGHGYEAQQSYDEHSSYH